MNEFDIMALSWDNEPRRLERARAVADKIVAQVPFTKEMKGFEYGCGTGLLSFCLLPYLKEITLGDSSEGMISVLKDKIAQAGIDNMKPLKINLIEQEATGEKYDIIYTLMTLHHIFDTEKILKTLAGCLNNSSYICIADLDREDGSFHGEGFDGHNGFDRQKLAQQLIDCGLDVVFDEICYTVNKKILTGEDRAFPVFLMIARKAD